MSAAVRRTKVGRDLLPAGRLVRVLAGILFLAAATATGLSLLGSAPWALLQVPLTVLVAAIAYTILVWVLGERFLARVDPWLAALVLVLPLAIVGVLPWVPVPVAVGVDFYIALSLLVQAAIGYGGCEIAGIPSLVLRRRYTVYCVLNGVDAVEGWLRGRSRWVAWALAILAFAITLALIVGVQLIGKTAGYWVAYMAFLAAGFVANRVVAARQASAGRSADPAGGNGI
ncbi:MAG: DUF6410 domain-containing protein [Candidatus Dormibacteraceae bacterium]